MLVIVSSSMLLSCGLASLFFFAGLRLAGFGPEAGKRMVAVDVLLSSLEHDVRKQQHKLC